MRDARHTRPFYFSEAHKRVGYARLRSYKNIYSHVYRSIIFAHSDAATSVFRIVAKNRVAPGHATELVI